MNTVNNYIKNLVKQYRLYVFLLTIIAICTTLGDILINYQVKEIVDTIQANPEAHVTQIVCLYILYKFLFHIMYFFRRLLDIKYKPKMLKAIVIDMYKSTVGQSLHWFDSHLSGEISSKILDFQHNVTTIISNLFGMVCSLGAILIGICSLLYVNTLPGIITILFVIIHTPITYYLLKKQMLLQDQYVKARQESSGIINDSIANMFGVKIIGSLAAEFKLKLIPSIVKWANWDRKTRLYDAWVVDNIDTLLSIIMRTIQICALVYLYKAREITSGEFMFIIMITMNIHRSLDSILENIATEITPKIAIIKSSFEFINTPVDVQDGESYINYLDAKGDIRFDNVSFCYPGSTRNIFENLNLHIPQNQKIGIVGTSGAGKTTLVKCILRYFNLSAGSIFIDGVDAKNMTQESLWSCISMIPQDITMFHRSVVENVRIARYDATMDEIIEACRQAKIHDDIINMPSGYDSIVGERGVKVSGGQRQRIAIARAILKNAPILILDEATSALDTPTEHMIQASLDQIFQSKNVTTIVVAHRLSTLLRMDRILVLDNGKIIEDGSHAELLARGGVYKKLWDAQVGGFLV